MSYRLAKLLPVVDSHYLIASDDDDAKSSAAEYLHSQPAGTYVLLSSDPENGKHQVVTTYEVKTSTSVAELLAQFKL